MTQVQSVQIPFPVSTETDARDFRGGPTETAHGFHGVLAGLISSDACGPVGLDDVQSGGKTEGGTLTGEMSVEAASGDGRMAAEIGNPTMEDAPEETAGIDDGEAQAAFDGFLAVMVALGVQEDPSGGVAKPVSGAETAIVPGGAALDVGEDLLSHNVGGLEPPETPADRGTGTDGTSAKLSVQIGGEYQGEAATADAPLQGKSVTGHEQKGPDVAMTSGQISESVKGGKTAFEGSVAPEAPQGAVVSSGPEMQAAGEVNAATPEVKGAGRAAGLYDEAGVSDAADAEVAVEVMTESEGEGARAGMVRSEDDSHRTRIRDHWSAVSEPAAEMPDEVEADTLDHGAVERGETPPARTAKGEHGSQNDAHKTNAARQGKGMHRGLLRAEAPDGVGAVNTVPPDDGEKAVTSRFVPDARATTESMAVTVGGHEDKLHSVAARGNDQAGGQMVSAPGPAGQMEQLAAAEKAGLPEAEHPAPQHVDRQAVLDQVVRSARLHIERGAARFEMRLEPPRLGKIGVVMELRDGAMTISFRADTESVREILQNSLPQLKAALGAQGLSIDGLDVSASGNGRGGQTDTDGRGVPGNGRGRTADDYRSHESFETPVSSGSRRPGYVEFWA